MFLRKKWAWRLSVAVTMAVAVVGIDGLWPKPATLAVYRAGVFFWFANSLPFNKEVAVSLFRFSGYRHFAPAQIAMYKAYRSGNGVAHDLDRAADWFRGAESQGYLPTLYHRSWRLAPYDKSLREEADLEFEQDLVEPDNLHRPAEEVWADTKRRVFQERIIYAVMAHFAVDAGDPFARYEVRKWWVGLSGFERVEVKRVYREWRSREFDPLPPFDWYCQMPRLTRTPDLLTDMETAMRCLEYARQHPAGLVQWRAFRVCTSAFPSAGDRTDSDVDDVDRRRRCDQILWDSPT
jgi:hypothetical protein